LLDLDEGVVQLVVVEIKLESMCVMFQIFVLWNGVVMLWLL